MADLSWISALTNQGGGGGSSGGVSDYDQLKNRPVTNIAGTGTVISALETGVYNIEGTWKLTPDDIERETLADDLFYVMNNGAESKRHGSVLVRLKPMASPLAVLLLILQKDLLLLLRK